MSSSSGSRPTSESGEGCGGLCRREFLGQALLLALTGCTIPPRTFRTRIGDDATIRVPLARYPELADRGRLVRVQTRDAGVIFVVHPPEGEIFALSGSCTHMGVTVAPSGGGFYCPAHGSAFTTDGKPLGGPARQPLPRYETRREGETIVVDLRSA